MPKPTVFRSGKHRVVFDPESRGGKQARGVRVAEVVAAWPALPEVMGAIGLVGAITFEGTHKPEVTPLGERQMKVGKRLRPVSLYLLQTTHQPGASGTAPELVAADVIHLDAAVTGLAEVTTNGFYRGLEEPRVRERPELSNGLLHIVDAVNGGGVDRVEIYAPLPNPDHSRQHDS